MMGVADLIPGVSGGTIAFITGIHRRLLESLATLHWRNIRHPKNIDWFFLTAVVGGILFSLAMGSRFIYSCLRHPLAQGPLRGLFFGFILGSLFFCFKSIERKGRKTIFFSFSGILLALGVSCIGFLPGERLYDLPLSIEKGEELINYDPDTQRILRLKESEVRFLLAKGVIDSETLLYSHRDDKEALSSFFFPSPRHSFVSPKLILCGTLSICAMLLPGISGSYVMQLFNSYELIIGSIARWTSGIHRGDIFNDSFWVLFNVGLGILIGIFFFVRFLLYAYRKYAPETTALMIGFMSGTLHYVWPFWQIAYKLNPIKPFEEILLERIRPVLPNLHSLHAFWVLGMIVLGFFAVVLPERIASRLKEKSAPL